MPPVGVSMGAFNTTELLNISKALELLQSTFTDEQGEGYRAARVQEIIHLRAKVKRLEMEVALADPVETGRALRIGFDYRINKPNHYAHGIVGVLRNTDAPDGMVEIAAPDGIHWEVPSFWLEPIA